MSESSEGDDAAIADRAADVSVSAPTLIARGFMDYERYQLSLAREHGTPLRQQRDLLRGARVAAVLPIDLVRGEVVLIRQFRLAAHLATGRGEMVEIVAGRIEADETTDAAARRECVEEIGVAPQRLLELFSVMTTPGITDEIATFFLGFVDAEKLPARGGVDHETEETQPFAVTIDDAIAALDGGRVANALLLSALQWLAINRARLDACYRQAV